MEANEVLALVCAVFFCLIFGLLLLVGVAYLAFNLYCSVLEEIAEMRKKGLL